MQAYKFQETQNLQSARVNSETINAKTLAAAKRVASKRQLFEGTTLKLLNTNGDLIAYKKPNAKWVDTF